MEIKQLRAFNDDLTSDLATLSEAAARAQGEAAEACAKAGDLERNFTAARRRVTDSGHRFDDL